MLRFLTAGESHGESLIAILEGLPAGLEVSSGQINLELARRQKGYGRGKRMEIESDKVEFFSGMRGGRTLGSPLAMRIKNRDWDNWQNTMGPEGRNRDARSVSSPRPGHADLAGGIKYGHKDFRNILERASARETAARVAVGAVVKALLERCGVTIGGHVVSIGGSSPSTAEFKRHREGAIAETSPVRCLDKSAEREMVKLIDKAMEDGETLGGVFEIKAFDVPVGLGSHVHWDRRLDSDLASAVMSIPAIKGVQIGSGFRAAQLPGSAVHDAIFYDKTRGFYRETNNAGGIEGGITNGETVILSAAMKPIPTLMSPLGSVHFLSKRKVDAAVERSDVTAVPAACVIGESMVAFVLAKHMCEKFGGDSMDEMLQNLEAYKSYIEKL
ncbi:MAG: chorismate synthase [bacterium]|nr:chorismate synthase [bacterium]MDT8365900.1 chorismate synthase [bacterium]